MFTPHSHIWLVNHSANDAMRDENYFIYPMFVKLFYACIDGDSLWYEKCSLSVLVPMELSQCEKVCRCLSGKRFRGWSGLFIMDNFLFSILSSRTSALIFQLKLLLVKKPSYFPSTTLSPCPRIDTGRLSCHF